jgi:hypothetical protein
MPPKMNRIQFKGKTSLMKELQRTAAFRAYNDVFTSGGSKAAKELNQKAFDIYFDQPGNEDSIGYARQLVKGMSAFGSLYEKEKDLANGAIILTMKSIFHCLDQVIISSDKPKDKGINMAVMTSKGLNNRATLTARQIWDFGKQVEKNGKKALALVQSSEYADGKIPSGKTYEDYLLFLREAMYK